MLDVSKSSIAQLGLAIIFFGKKMSSYGVTSKQETKMTDIEGDTLGVVFSFLKASELIQGSLFVVCKEWNRVLCELPPHGTTMWILVAGQCLTFLVLHLPGIVSRNLI